MLPQICTLPNQAYEKQENFIYSNKKNFVLQSKKTIYLMQNSNFVS